MTTFRVEFEYTRQFRCEREIEAGDWEEAEAIAAAMIDDIPEEEFEDIGYSECEAYVMDELDQ